MGWVWWIDWQDDCDYVGGTRGFQLYPAGQRCFASSGPSLTRGVHSVASPGLLVTVRNMERK